MLSDIQKLLPYHPWQNTILYFDVIDSTNTYCKTLAAEGAPEGTVVLADHQTGGRGRLGRSFSSAAGMGVYMSVLLRPNCLPEELMHLTCATGVYASIAIEHAVPSVIAPKIKWANDLVMGTKKIGGILTELSIDTTTRKVEWVVIGIGINCCQTTADFPEEIREIACSLDIAPAGRVSLIAELICQMHAMRQELFTKKCSIMEAFRSRCVTIGKQISIVRGDQVQHGTAISVDPDGSLQVILEDGSEAKISSGEVSIRGMYGYL